MTVTIYGIRNCDTMRRAFAWLREQGIDYTFHDYKSAGIARDALDRWCDAAGWETLLNRNGTTFRRLPDHAKADLDRDKAIGLMLEHTSLIKRPILELRDALEIGFRPARYAELLDA